MELPYTYSKSAGRMHIIRDYLQLTKPRIVFLLVFTAVASIFVAAQGAYISPIVVLGTLVGGALSAAGASALNQYFDRELDRQMARTKHRPLPSGRILPINALVFGIMLLVWSVLVLMAAVNVLAAFLALFGAFYYILIYTLWLKRHSTWNIVIGGAAGGMPVLVGWAAATGGLSIGALILFAIIFFWTPPHSWALMLFTRADYQHARLPMMPVVYGDTITHLQIVFYALLLVILTLLPLPLGILGLFYFVMAALLGAGLIALSLYLLYKPGAANAWQLYKYSSYYLGLLFLVMIIDGALL